MMITIIIPNLNAILFNKKNTDLFFHLPNEIKLHVFSFLTPKALLPSALVGKENNRLVNTVFKAKIKQEII